MGRLSRRRRLRLCVVGALVVGLLWGVSAAYAESQTVTFRGGPLAPVLCPSAPDLPSLDIVKGTWVNVVNQTGAAATLAVDGVASQTIAKGGGLSVMLPAGRHDLRLIPHCPTQGKLRSVVVDVAVLAPPSSGSPPGPSSTVPAPSGDSTADRQVRVDVPGSYAGGDGSRVSSPVTAGSTGRPPSVPPGAVLRSGPGAEAVQADFLVVPYPVPVTEDPRGERLLTVIAVICVFGVTAAVIRAILAQRTKAR